MSKAWAVMLVLLVGASPTSIAGDPVAGMKRIGILYPDTQEVASVYENFREALQELGYVEGKNVTYDYRLAPPGEMDRVARDMVRAGVDLIYAPGTPAAVAAKRASSTIPIVFLSADPEEAGLVVSLAHPGGNATGLGQSSATDLGPKRLELLRELLPRATRLAVLINPDNQTSKAQWESIESAARKLGFKLRALDVRRREDLDATLLLLNRKQFDAFVVALDVALIAQQDRIGKHALGAKLPGIFAYRPFAEAGGLVAYGSDLNERVRELAAYADKILRGAKPADLPVQQATRFYLILNQRTAKAMGVTIPESILVRADEVIK